MSKKTFISHSHSDKEFTHKLATNLMSNGIDVWLDAWEISAGDSIVDKIFAHGLATCSSFLVIISQASITSKWVKEELSFATVKRIEDSARVIPILIEKVDLPPPLRTLKYLNFSSGYDAPFEELVDTLLGRNMRPPLGPSPQRITQLSTSVKELTKVASTLGHFLIKLPLNNSGDETFLSGPKILEGLPFLNPNDINEAISELKEFGLVSTIDFLGTAPFDFGHVQPTYTIFLYFKDSGLDYNPEMDIKTIAALVAAEGQLEGSAIQTMAKLHPARINRAVKFLEDCGVVKVMKFLGTAPFSFGIVQKTHRTKIFVEENCR